MFCQEYGEAVSDSERAKLRTGVLLTVLVKPSY